MAVQVSLPGNFYCFFCRFALPVPVGLWPATIKGEHEDDVAVIEYMKGTPPTHPPTHHFKLMVLRRPLVALG
jgi:hypothetical protein